MVERLVGLPDKRKTGDRRPDCVRSNHQGSGDGFHPSYEANVGWVQPTNGISDTLLAIQNARACVRKNVVKTYCDFNLSIYFPAVQKR